MTRRENPYWAANLVSGLQQNLPETMRSSMQTQVEAEAKRIVYLGHPNHLKKKTGNLQRSITTELSVTGKEIAASVGTNVGYAPVHEFGAVITDRAGVARFIPPRPFLLPAFEAKRGAVLEDFKNGFRRIVQEISLK